MRRTWQRLADHPDDLPQFLHQIRFRMQPAGRINQYDIGRARLGRHDAVECHGRRIRPVAMPDHVHAHPIRPYL